MRSTLLLLLALVACLPQVGPPVLDGSTGEGGGNAGGTGSTGGGAGGSSGGGSGGGDPGCPGYAGCVSFVAPASADVVFPNGNDTFAPKCLRVTVGQRVTFTGSFLDHPLTQACGPQSVLGQRSGSFAQYTFTAPGTYGYYCEQHGTAAGADMAGAIEVVP